MEIIQNGSITSAKGFLACGVNAGFKESNFDFMLLFSKIEATVAGVFTKNQVIAAPVIYCKELLDKNSSIARVVAINSGVANACTGERGLKWCKETAELISKKFDVASDQVYLASTGVIGRDIDMSKIALGIEKSADNLNPEGGVDAAKAIMTTDTVSKSIAIRCTVNGNSFIVGGMAKGSGMIAPNMATMLSVITTDVKIQNPLLQSILKNAADKSFNLVTIDGDTSTNDTVLILANGMSNIEVISGSEEEKIFTEAIFFVCVSLAKMIAKDGEGATKMIEIEVCGAKTEEDARKIAMTIANSPLVKTAMFGNDPNWGRVFAAAGRAGVEFDQAKCDLIFAGVEMVKSGEPIPFDKKWVGKQMQVEEVKVSLDLHQGESTATSWTCDFSYEYVKINGEYTT